MVSQTSVLIVDPDSRSLRVLEVSLRRAGFKVRTAEAGKDGWRIALESIPDVIVTETQLPDESGFDLVQRLRSEPRTARAALVFLSHAAAPKEKTRAIEAGADDFLAKPVLVKEILNRMTTLLERRGPPSVSSGEDDTRLRGSLAHLGVIDIVQVMEAGSRTCVVRLSSTLERSGGYATPGHDQATLYFQSGRLVDGKLGVLSGADVLYRLLMWEDGDFEIERTQVEQPDRVQTSTQALLLEGLRRLDEWTRLREQLPEDVRHLSVDHAELARVYPEGPPPEMQTMVERFDDARSVFEVLEGAPLDGPHAMDVIRELYEQGVLLAPPEPEPSSSVIPLGRASVPDGPEAVSGLPSALGRAMIPSPHSPSEILLREAGTSEANGSLLSRRTVLAGRTDDLVPHNGMGTSDAPRVQPPQLTIRKVSARVPHGPVEGVRFRPDRAHSTRASAPKAISRRVSAVRGVRPFRPWLERLVPWSGPSVLALFLAVVGLGYVAKDRESEPTGTTNLAVVAHPRGRVPPRTQRPPGNASRTAQDPSSNTTEAPDAEVMLPEASAPARAVALAVSDAEEALRAEDIAAAETRFRAAVGLDRSHAAARSGLAYALLAQERLRAAHQQATSSLQLDDRNARANLVLGTIAQNRGQLEDACRRYRRYLELGGGPMATEIRAVIAERCPL